MELSSFYVLLYKYFPSCIFPGFVNVSLLLSSCPLFSEYLDVSMLLASGSVWASGRHGGGSPSETRPLLGAEPSRWWTRSAHLHKGNKIMFACFKILKTLLVVLCLSTMLYMQCILCTLATATGCPLILDTPQTFLSMKYLIHLKYSQCQTISIENLWHLK